MLLLIDNASSHHIQGLTLKNTVIKFLPPNTTSRLQPLDAGIIKTFKLKYKSKFIRYLLSHIETNPINEPNFDLLSGLEMVVKAWDEVKPQKIQNCWFHIRLIAKPSNLHVQEIDDSIELHIEDLNLPNPMFAEDYMNIVEEEVIEDCDNANQDSDNDESDCDLEIESISEPKVKTIDAIKSCDILMEFILQQSEDLSLEMRSLRQLNAKLNQINVRNKVQSSILDYFKVK